MTNYLRKSQESSALVLLSCFLCLPLILSASPGQAQEVFDTFLEPYLSIEISSPFRDRLSIIHVKDGDEIQKDQVLAELSTNVLLARKKQAEEAAVFTGAVNSARALVTMRRNRLKLVQELEKKGNVRPQELIKARTDLAMAQAQLQESEEEKLLRQLDLAVIDAQLEEKKLRSPIHGVVVKVHKQEAELVGGVDSQPLMTIVQLDPLAAVFHLPPEYTKKMTINNAVTLEIAGSPVQGTIEYIAPIIDPQSGTVQIKVILSNPDGRLISGSRCTLQLELE